MAKKKSSQKKPKTKIDEVNDGLKFVTDVIDTLSKNAPLIADTMQRLFNSFTPGQQQLPPPPHSFKYNVIPPAPATINPCELFGLRSDAPQDLFKQRYRDLMKIYHPDSGAQNDAMAKRVNAAWEAIRKEKGWV